MSNDSSIENVSSANPLFGVAKLLSAAKKRVSENGGNLPGAPKAQSIWDSFQRKH